LSFEQRDHQLVGGNIDWQELLAELVDVDRVDVAPQHRRE
jgi:hypothetical protein